MGVYRLSTATSAELQEAEVLSGALHIRVQFVLQLTGFVIGGGTVNTSGLSIRNPENFLPGETVETIVEAPGDLMPLARLRCGLDCYGTLR